MGGHVEGKRGGSKTRTAVITASDPAWDGYLARLPNADVYHTAAYHRAHEANGDGTALVFVAEDGDNLLFHPFMLREIPGTPYRDAETVYGYSGPLATNSHPTFTGPAWWAFQDWTETERIVAAFQRFNPLSSNERCADIRCRPEFDRYTVVLDLMGRTADIFNRGEKRHRDAVHNALSRGLVADRFPLDYMEVFKALYRGTMEQNEAADYYSFSDAYFEALEKGLGDNLWLFLVRAGSQTVAAALFMAYRDRVHYHLAGSDPEFRGWNANNLLLHSVAMYAWEEAVLYGELEHGYRWLHLGGGRTNAPDDSLLRFKASVSRERRPFYVGKRIHDEAAYRELCEDWRRRHPGEDDRYFLLWRKPCA